MRPGRAYGRWPRVRGPDDPPDQRSPARPRVPTSLRRSPRSPVPKKPLEVHPGIGCAGFGNRISPTPKKILAPHTLMQQPRFGLNSNADADNGDGADDVVDHANGGNDDSRPSEQTIELPASSYS